MGPHSPLLICFVWAKLPRQSVCAHFSSAIYDELDCKGLLFKRSDDEDIWIIAWRTWVSPSAEGLCFCILSVVILVMSNPWSILCSILTVTFAQLLWVTHWEDHVLCLSNLSVSCVRRGTIGVRVSGRDFWDALRKNQELGLWGSRHVYMRMPPFQCRSISDAEFITRTKDM